MRTLSENIQRLMLRPDASSVYFVKIETVSGTNSYHTTGVSTELVLGNYYEPSAGLMTIEAPRISEAVDRETYKIVYIDPNFELISRFESGLAGARITVYLAMYNTTGSNMSSDGLTISPGRPLLGASDLVIAYQGFIDTQGYTINPKEGTVIAVLEGSSPVASLGQVKAFYSSRENMRRHNTADTSFNAIYVGSAKVALLWGKRIDTKVSNQNAFN